MKKGGILLLLLLGIFSLAGSVFACTIPTDDMSLSADTVLCSGIFHISDAGLPGVIRFGSSNVTLICNGTEMIGSGSGIGVNAEGEVNISIVSCNLTNYSIGIYLRSTNFSALLNNSLDNAYGAYLNGSKNDRIYYNIINSSNGFFVEDVLTVNNNISLNHFYDGGVNDSGTSNSYCNFITEEEGNLYEMNIPFANTGFDDCGFSNVTIPYANQSMLEGTQTLNLSWYNQSSILPITYDVEYSNNSGADWNGVVDGLNGENYTWDISGLHWGFNYRIRVTPHDSKVNGTRMESEDFVIHPRCSIVNSNITGSEFWNYSWLSRPCRIVNSTVTNSNVTSSVIINSTINRSFLYDSYMYNSSSNESSIMFSEIKHAIFCNAFDAFGASVIGNQLTTGRITFNSTQYFAPALLTQICDENVPPYDPTPPTAPTSVNDGLGADLDWFNTNTSMSANWEGATEDISTIYYRYVLLANGTCLAGYCNWTSAGTNTSVIVTGLNLSEGSNYSFVVQAYNSYGGSAANASSDGSVLDITKPSAPSISSPSHPVELQAYANTTAIFRWNSSDGNSTKNESGIEGYSFLLDKDQGSAPDDVLEAQPKITLQSMANDGSSADLKGNGSGSAKAVFIEILQNVSVGDTLEVRAALAERDSETTDIMKYQVYAIKKSSNVQSGGFAFNETDERISEVLTFERDVDYTSDLETATHYSTDLTLNDSVNGSTSEVVYVVVAGMQDDDDNQNNLSIAASTNADNSTKSFICDELDSCSDTTNSTDYAIGVKVTQNSGIFERTYSSLADGTYYFHVKAKDLAGNMGNTATYGIKVYTGSATVAISSPFTGQSFNNESINVTVNVNMNSTVYVHVLHPDGGNYTSAQQNFTGVSVFSGVTLEEGMNRLYARAINNISQSAISETVYVTLSGTAAETNTTLQVTYSDSGAASSPYLVLKDTGTYSVGFGTENNLATATSTSLQSDTSFHSTKIFMTYSGLDSAGIFSDLQDDEIK
ncbi:MAG: fibronectin type III domain-containing protein, partial [Candidatus Nanoarchaeia archaeon]